MDPMTQSQPSPGEMTREVVARLGMYDAVGVAPSERLVEAPAPVHPRNLLPGLGAVIVYARGRQYRTAMGPGDRLLEYVAGQNQVHLYLQGLGYETLPLLPTDPRISLPRLGAAAGLGDISGVGSLFIEDYGLSASLGGILTTAPLAPTRRADPGCTECWECVESCPAAEAPHQMDPTLCTACNGCVEACPYSQL